MGDLGTIRSLSNILKKHRMFIVFSQSTTHKNEGVLIPYCKFYTIHVFILGKR